MNNSQPQKQLSECCGAEIGYIEFIGVNNLKSKSAPVCEKCQKFCKLSESPEPALHLSMDEGVVHNPDGTIGEWREVGERAKRNIIDETKSSQPEITTEEECECGHFLLTYDQQEIL